MIALAAPPPPPVVAPAPVVYGRVTVRIGARTTGIRAVLDGRARTLRRVPRGPRRVTLTLPPGRWGLAVRAVGPGGARTSASRVVWVLPRAAERAGTTVGRLDRRLQREVAARVSSFPATSGVYVQNLVTGCGAAVNAGAPFPAASTLKAAILLEAVRRGGIDGRLLDAMAVDSDDAAANRVLVALGGGSGEAGGAAVTATMRRIGMAGSLIRRPYIIEETARIPVESRARPQLFTNFIATPHELALLHVSLHRGGLGVGAVRRMGLGRARVRAGITRRLLEVRDRSKIVAGVPASMPVAHKTGYTTEVKHDAGVVHTPAGPVVVSVMTWSAAGVGDGAGNAFIADIARMAVRRLGGASGGVCR